MTAMNIAIENGYDHVLYSFKKKELMQQKNMEEEENFTFHTDEQWINFPHQKYVTIVEDDHSMFFHILKNI